MARKQFIIFFLLSCFATAAMAQNPAGEAQQALRLNDTIPNIEVGYSHQSQSRTDNMADLYSGGGLIINFWATWCAPCIGEMKLLDSLRSATSDSLSVISVTYQDSKTIESFFERNPWAAKSGLYVVTEDTTLRKYFPHNTIPHNAWIDRHGRLKGITGKDELNIANVQRLVGGQDLNFLPKADDMEFDYRKPLHIEDSLIQYRSIFNSHLPNVNFNGLVVSRKGYTKPTMRRFFGFNYNITQLFWAAYSRQSIPYPNHYLIEIITNDSSKFYYPDENRELFARSGYKTKQEWMEKNTYAYELRLHKPAFPDVFFNYVIQDLERNLAIESNLAKKRRDCIVVTIERKKRKDLLMAKADERDPHIEITEGQLLVRNATINDLLQWITQKTFNYQLGRKEPYIYEGMDFPINISVPLDTTLSKERRLEMIENGLRQYGFEFAKARKKYPVLVIRDLE